MRWWLGNCLWHCFTHIMKNEETGWDHDNNNIGHYPVIILYITIMMQGDDLRNLLLIYTYVDWTWSKITGPLVLKCLKHCRISRYRDPNVDGKTVMCCSMYTFFPWQLCHTHTGNCAQMFYHVLMFQCMGGCTINDWHQHQPPHTPTQKFKDSFVHAFYLLFNVCLVRLNYVKLYTETVVLMCQWFPFHWHGRTTKRSSTHNFRSSSKIDKVSCAASPCWKLYQTFQPRCPAAESGLLSSWHPDQCGHSCDAHLFGELWNLLRSRQNQGQTTQGPAVAAAMAIDPLENWRLIRFLVCSKFAIWKPETLRSLIVSRIA